MKYQLTILFSFLLTSCNADIPTNFANQNNKKEFNYPCLVAGIGKIGKFIGSNNAHLYYRILYGNVDNVYDNLKLIVSEFDFTKDIKVDTILNYRNETTNKLTKCLQVYNENSYVQDIWFDMKESLDPIDEVNQEKRAGKNGYYPKESLYILNPNIDTFKIDTSGAEIKSYIYSNHADTQITTIKWKFKDGKYVFHKYTTTTIDDYDPAVD